MQLNELKIFGHVRRLFELLHEDISTKIPKVDRMSTGMILLSKCAESVQLIRKINQSRDKRYRAILFIKLKSIIYDIDSILILYRECRIISIKRHSVLAAEIAGALEQYNNWSNHFESNTIKGCEICRADCGDYQIQPSSLD